jgi:hypothetical protein
MLWKENIIEAIRLMEIRKPKGCIDSGDQIRYDPFTYLCLSTVFINQGKSGRAIIEAFDKCAISVKIEGGENFKD